MVFKRSYDKKSLFDIIDKLSITREGNTIITKYNGNIIKTATVSKIYELFDISNYIKNKIETIEKNFKINEYRFEIVGGKQYLILLSDTIDITGTEFQKAFYILNSSDKSRRLSFSVGLKSKNSNFYAVGTNLSLNKKHLKGLNKAAEDISENLNGETFDEQIESIRSLVNHKVKFSKVREVILDNDNFDDVTEINHKSFDAFKNVVRWEPSLNLNNEQKNFLYKRSKTINNIPEELDFYLDAFWVFKEYLRIFNKQDSHIVRKKTELIMKITQWSIRNATLEKLGIN